MLVSALSPPAGDDAALCPAADPFCLAEANINPGTGLSTDYLNHFNEAVMLLEMVPVMPECRADLMIWQPLTYSQHFASSHLKHRELAIAAYDVADPLTRRQFDEVCEAMTATILAARASMAADVPPEVGKVIAERAAGWLKPLLARASALIHGFDSANPGIDSLQESQAAVDAILDP